MVELELTLLLAMSALSTLRLLWRSNGFRRMSVGVLLHGLLLTSRRGLCSTIDPSTARRLLRLQMLTALIRSAAIGFEIARSLLLLPG